MQQRRAGVNSSTVRYGKLHGRHPEDPGDLRSYHQLVDELGPTAAHELTISFYHVDLQGRPVIDVDSADDQLRLLDRRR
jgi:hypothetical protein